MAFELKQNLKLAQQLVMTPQLQQAIKLLQLSRLELLDSITQMVEMNPLLEEAGREDAEQPEPAANEEEKGLDVTEPPRERTREITGEGDGGSDFDWQAYFEDRVTAPVIHERRDADDAPSWDNVMAARPSLADHLLWQLGLSHFTEKEREIAQLIIGNLDGDGYLREDLETIASQMKTETAQAEAVLKRVQEFDPPGVAARDLRECLLIQAESLGVAASLVKTIVRDHLKNVELKNYSAIAKKLSLPLEEVLEAIDLIRHMDPKPGGIYSLEQPETIIPDVFVIKTGTEYRVILNDESLPQLRINHHYRNLLNAGNKNPDRDRKFIRENYQTASWFIKSIEQRQKTIARVAESIVRHQKDFFDRGINHLKPLVLRDIAADVGMHESTISRVVTGKYMQIPSGIFELKFFFGSAINTTAGSFVSSRSVMDRIRKLVNAENPEQPCLDHEIVAQLKEEGIKISRRTVAKYRDILKILPASRRRKFI